MPKSRDEIDELVAWQLDQGRRRGLYPPPAQRPPAKQPSQWWARVSDRIAAIIERR